MRLCKLVDISLGAMFTGGKTLKGIAYGGRHLMDMYPGGQFSGVYDSLRKCLGVMYNAG